MKRVLLIVLFFLPHATQAQDFAKQALSMLWITEHYPPMHYAHDNELKGIAVDIILRVFERKHVNFNPRKIKVYPWARAYQTLVTDENAAVFTMASTPEREMLFYLVGPVGTTKVSLLAKPEKQIRLLHIADLGQFNVGVVRQDVGETLLNRYGLPSIRLVQVKESTDVIKMLLKDRVDLISYSEDTAQFYLNKFDSDFPQFEVVKNLQEMHQYFAFNRNIPRWFIEEFQDEIDRMRVSGELASIRMLYLPQPK